MSTQQLPENIMEQLEFIKKELIDVSNGLSVSTAQLRLSKVSEKVVALVIMTYSQGKTQSIMKDEEPKSKSKSTDEADKWNNTQNGQEPPDLFIRSSSSIGRKPFESSKNKNMRSKKHQRGESRHQRMCSMNSASDFEQAFEQNILNELKQIAPDDNSSSDGEKEVSDSTGHEEEEVGIPEIVTGSEYNETPLHLGAGARSKDRNLISTAGKTKEYQKSTSVGGVVEINGSNDELRVAKQIQSIIGKSKDDLGDLAWKLLQLKTSKIDLVISTSEEISRLREIIMMLGRQLQHLREQHRKSLNASFGGQIFGAIASIFYS